MIYFRGDIQIITKLGRDLPKWVNLVLEGAHVTSHPSRGARLPLDDSAEATLVM